MKKIIISLAVTITFTNNIIPMDPPKPSTPFSSELDQLILFHSLKNTHTHATTIIEARNHIQKISVVNKNLYTLANSPHIIRDIISKLSHSCDQYTVATTIATPGTKNYYEKTQLLHKRLQGGYRRKTKQQGGMLIPIFIPVITADTKTISNLIDAGADINCMATTNQSSLQCAIKAENTELTELFLSYKPQNIHFADALNTENPTIIKLCLKHGNVTSDERNDALKTAIEKKQKDTVQVLLDAGVNPSPQLHHAVLHALTHVADYFFYSDPAPSLEIITLMCLYGAYSLDAMELAITTKGCPQELKNLLEMGLMIASGKSPNQKKFLEKGYDSLQKLFEKTDSTQ
jgi:hypothetical protein